MREVLRHKSVEKAVLCEIDRAVVDMSIKYFPEVSAGAFDNARAEIVIADGLKFVAETKQRFDAILVDSTDPQGPGAVLFTKQFYTDCRRCLKKGGVLVTQNGVPFMQADELKQSVSHFRALFKDGGCYLATVPTYAGGQMAFGWASDDHKLKSVKLGDIRERFEAADIATKYYTPAVHKAAFALPAFIERIIAP